MNANVYSQQKKSPICGETCSDLTQPCTKRFFHWFIILDLVKISPDLCIYINLLWCVKKRENLGRKNSYFFFSAAFTMIVFFTLL